MDIFCFDTDESDGFVSKLNYRGAVYVLDMGGDVRGRVNIQTIHVALDLEHVAVVEAHNDVLAATTVELETIRTGAADHGVVAVTSNHKRRTGTADQHFIAAASNERIATAAAHDSVVAGPALEIVVSNTTMKHVVCAGSDYRIAAATAHNGVVAGAGALNVIMPGTKADVVVIARKQRGIIAVACEKRFMITAHAEEVVSVSTSK